MQAFACSMGNFYCCLCRDSVLYQRFLLGQGRNNLGIRFVGHKDIPGIFRMPELPGYGNKVTS